MTADELSLEVYLHRHFVEKGRQVLNIWDPFSHGERRQAAAYGVRMGWLVKATLTPARNFTSTTNGRDGQWFYLTDEGRERFFNRKS